MKVDPQEAPKSHRSEKIFTAVIIVLLALMFVLYKSFNGMDINVSGTDASKGGRAETQGSPGSASREGLSLFVRGFRGEFSADSHYRYSGSIENRGKTSVDAPIVCIELFDAASSAILNRDRVLFPELPPGKTLPFSGSMRVPESVGKIVVSVEFENYAAKTD